MKRHSSRNKIFLSAWIIFHIALVVVFFASLKFHGKLKVDADFTTMIPSTATSVAERIAEKSIGENSGDSVFILAGNADFEKAKSAAEKVYSILKSNDENANEQKRKFKQISLYTDSSSYTEIIEFLREYRFVLLDSIVQNEIDSDSLKFADNALSKFYGFSLSELDPVNDPFAFDDVNMKNVLDSIAASSVAMSPKDRVLARNLDGTWFVMIRAELTKYGAKLASETNAVSDIYSACLPLETDGTRFAFFGTPFHSHKSSTNAQKEITVISAVSMIAVIAILIFVFRSPIPIFASVFAIFISVASAFLATHAIFGNVHAIALVFGTTLIGSCIDYSLHFFINWKGAAHIRTGGEIRTQLSKGILLSLVSTEICYLLLMISPFALLKQISAFSFFGIMSTFLTVFGIFPLIKLPKEKDRRIFIPNLKFSFAKKFSGKKRNLFGKVVIFVIGTFIVVSGILDGKLKIENNVSNLYKMEGRLKEDTETAYRVLQYNPTSYLIVSADSAEEVLLAEEEIAKKISDPYICTSRFIPSVKMQKKSLKAAEKLLPLSKNQMKNVLFGSENEISASEEKELAELAENYESFFHSSSKKFVTPESEEIPETLKSILKMIWIGEVNGRFYSVILPSNVSDESAYKKIAGDDERIHYANKAKDVGRGLDELTKTILKMFVVAFAIISLVMKFFHGWKDTLKIISVPVFSIMVILSTFKIADLPIEFFCVTGIMLVFGLGLDYVIYSLQNKGNRLERFAIALSFVTTAISFGAIALSLFVPVHTLGLSIFSGLMAAFIATML